MKKTLFIIVFILCATQGIYSQTDGVVSFDMPIRNSLKFNKYIINPTFSFVREQSPYVSIYAKKQWMQFDNAPQTLLLSYSGKFRENEAIAIGLFQQNYGLLTTFGGVANFAHNVYLAEDSNLTFGVNVGFYKSGLNTAKATVNDPTDPSLQNVPSNTLITVNPGINYGNGFIDFGASVNNAVLYNFKTSKMVADNNTRGIEAHIMYTGYMDSYGFFDKSKFSGIVKAEKKTDKTILSGLLLFSIPKGIWAQAGYNTLYGISAGLGLNITSNISLEYNFEKSTGNLVGLGSSHEIVLAYKFKNNNYNTDEEEEGALITTPEPAPTRPVAVQKSQEDIEKEQARQLDIKNKQDLDAKEAEAERLRKEKELADAKAKSEADRLLKLKEIEDAKNGTSADAKAKIEADRLLKLKQIEDAKARTAADAKAKIEADRLLKLKEIEDAKARNAADAKAKIDADRLNKVNADKLAQAKADADAKAKLEADRLLKEKQLADAKAKADADTKTKLEADRLLKEKQLADAKADADAKAKAKLEADRLLKEKQLADAKAKADADAKAKLEADRLLKEKQLADAKAKADADAKAKLEADRLLKEKQLADAKAKADEEARIAASKANKDKEIEEANRLLNESKKAQQEALAKLEAKTKELKDLKDANDLYEKEGIVKDSKDPVLGYDPTKALEALKGDIELADQNQRKLLTQQQKLLTDKIAKLPNRDDALNQEYQKEIDRLKAEQLKAEQLKANKIAEIDQLQEGFEVEKKRRIKRADFDDDKVRYEKDRATLNQLKTTTPKSAVPLKQEDFNFGEIEQQTGMPIIKNVANAQNGYYLILAIHKDIAKRDAFLAKAIASGQTNVDFFYDVNSGKYYIYSSKQNDLEEAVIAVDSKENKPENSKMAIVKIENK